MNIIVVIRKKPMTIGYNKDILFEIFFGDDGLLQWMVKNKYHLSDTLILLKHLNY
jgi:hypothetical protein